MNIADQLLTLQIVRSDGTLSNNHLRTKLTPELHQAIVDLTSYLPTAPMTERIWYIVNSMTEPVKCIQCNINTPKFRSFVHGYKMFCSSGCAHLHPSSAVKRRNTMLERHGVEHPLQSPEIKDRVVQKWVELYGVEHPSQNATVKAKVKATCLERYGTTTNLQTEDTIEKRLASFATNKDRIAEKRTSTMLERYGVETSFDLPSFKEQSIQTMLQRYGVEHPSYSADIRSKAKRTMLERYGIEYTLQSTELRDKICTTLLERYGQSNSRNVNVPKLIQTNLLRYGTPYGISSTEVRARIVDTNYVRYGYSNNRMKLVGKDNYSLLEDAVWMTDQYVTLKKPIYVIANELGVDDTTVNKCLRIHGIPIDNSSSTSYTEQFITKELDLYIPSKKLAIEFCGLYWHCDKHERMVANYHLDKLQQCESLGITLITVFEDEWIYHKELVLAKILHLLGSSSENKISARDTTVQPVDSVSKDMFFDAHHIQGSGPGSITYGLIHKGQIVACMTLLRKSSGNYILNRYSTNSNVRGGFSKLLSYFKTHHYWTSIITFADRRWSTGQLYMTNGFTHVNTLPPDYRYVIGNKRIHKFNFRRKRLAARLKIFDPKLSEVVNCKNNGLYRIWDCGLLKFETKNAN